MVDPITKISDKAQLATDAYINNTIITPIVSYSWAQAMRSAGYAESTIDSNSKETWGLVGVQDQIRQARTEIKAEHIATRAERQAWWSKVYKGEVDGASMGDKLRASELLGRSEADFTDKVHVDNSFSIDVVRFSKQIESNSAPVQPIIEAVKAPDRLTSSKAPITAVIVPPGPEVD